MTSALPRTSVSEASMRLLAFLTLFVIGTDTFLTAPLLPVLQREFQVPLEQAGWLVSAYALGYAMFALVSGPLSDRYDRRVVLLAGLVGFTVFTAGCGLTNSFWTMFVARFLAGVSASFVSPQIWASIPAVVPPNSIVKTMGAASAGLAVAMVAGIPIGSYLSALGWRIPFFAIAAASAGVWVILWRRFPHVAPTQDAAGPPLAPYKHIARSSSLVWSLVAYLVFQIGNFTALSFIGSWLARDFGASQTTIGTAMAVIGVGNAVGSLFGSRIVARIGSSASLAAGIIGLALAYLAAGFTGQLWSAVAVLALGLMIAGFLFPVLMSQLQSHTELARGTVSSLANAAMYVGGTVAGGIGGVLLASFPSYLGVGCFAAATYLMSLVAYRAAGAFRVTNQPS